MYYFPDMQPYHYSHPYAMPVCNCERQYAYWMDPYYEMEASYYGYLNHPSANDEARIRLKDHGREPYVVDIEEAAKKNKNFRTTLWTGDHLQLTVMRIEIGEDIGLEMHPDVDQFLRIEEGQAVVRMGDAQDHLYLEEKIDDDNAVVVPAGTWHNIINIGRRPLKLYTIYAPPEHPFGTVHKTKADAIAAEEG
ncbi:cupin domain-containing protein [Virgibacillus siamensis]|uniref:cupin domain-containing protein n=1 Tax=Virgibacillus siamensis TaxID=480071 RepID=UPI0009861783|nr:cupin domain-containing protein [Virgibacillus siamensis]